YVGVDAAEAERVDAGTARPPRDGLPPGGLEHRRQPGPLEPRMRLVAVQGRWQRPVVQRQRCLDEAGDPRRRHGMADHRLDRAAADGRRGTATTATALAAEDTGEGGEFGRIPGWRGRPMRLDQTHRPWCGRVETGVGPGTPEGELLA